MISLKQILLEQEEEYIANFTSREEIPNEDESDREEKKQTIKPNTI